ncbi:MFS transporter [Pseudomonas fluorescens]|uniref:Major facilitator superfamily (MFS) profile domain-containing protein n=1 Tax=Pseudomonas fluorescens TaxID=294 RepID=A0A423LFV2_PSEFL|nr:MFS transporter [Pseudomonas fluorescens]RON67201.1 hypothetical protein BK671_14590 [Pseudomonas fluorescens]
MGISSDSEKTLRIAIAATAAFAIGNLTWWMEPSIAHDMIELYRVDQASAGLIVSAEMLAIATSSFVTAKLIRDLPSRSIAIFGTILALIGTALSLISTEYWDLLCSRVLTGLGEGMPLAVASAVVASLRNPSRIYALMNTFNVSVGTCAVFLSPLVIPFFPAGKSSFSIVGLTILFLIIAMNYLPKSLSQARSPDQQLRYIAPSFIQKFENAALVSSVFLVTIMIAALWSFYYILGERAGLSGEA